MLQKNIGKIAIFFLVLLCCASLNAKTGCAAEESRPGQAFVTKVVLRGGMEPMHSMAQKAAEEMLLNKPAALETLQQAAEKISSLYRGKGYFLAKAYLPAQQSDDGSVTFVILEGRYGRIKLRNESWLPDDKLRGFTEKLKPGMAIRKTELERQLLLLADIPGLQVQSVLQPGETVGTADLVISLREGPRMNVSVQTDNYGDLSTGEWRSGLNAAVNHPLGGREGVEFGSIRFGGARTETNHFRYSERIGNDGMQATLSYAEKNYRLGGDYALLDSHGESSVWDLTLQYPLRRTEKDNLYASVGLSRRKIQDWLFGMQEGKWSGSVHGALYGDRHDDAGNALEYSLAYQNGVLHSDSEERRRFDKWNVSLLLRRVMNPLTYATVSFSGQWTPTQLDSSEKISIGGPAGIRAYAQGSGVGDSGWQLTSELHRRLGRTLELIAFADAGGSVNSFEDWRRMYGAGLGLEWGLEKWRIRMDYSWKVGRLEQDTDPAAGHWWLRMAHLF